MTQFHRRWLRGKVSARLAQAQRRAVVDSNAVLARALRLIKSVIGITNETSGVDLVDAWFDHTKTETRGQLHRARLGAEGISVDHLAQSLRKEPGSVDRSLRKRDQELVASIAGREVDLTDVLSDQLAHLGKNEATEEMIVGVVYGLEVVHVHHDHANGAVEPARARKFGVELVVDGAHVVEAREVVDVDERLQTLIGLLQPIREVLDAKLGSDASEEFHGIEGFADVIVGSGVEAADDVFRLASRTDEDHREIVVSLAEMLERIQAADAGHVDVQQDQRRLEALQFLECLFPARGALDTISLVLERQSHEREVIEVVVDDQERPRLGIRYQRDSEIALHFHNLSPSTFQLEYELDLSLLPIVAALRERVVGQFQNETQFTSSGQAVEFSPVFPPVSLAAQNRGASLRSEQPSFR